MIIDWAHPALAPRIIDLRLINKTRSAGESITGFEQVLYGVTQRWAFSLEFNYLKLSMVPAYRAMIASLEGRANALRVPVFDRQFWPSDAVLGIASATHSDGSAFSDETEYLTSDIEGITVSGGIGAKEITVDFGSYGEVFEAGLYFGIEDETYLATSVVWDGSEATINFQPGLRQTHVGSTFRLRPRLIMRLANDESGAHPLELGRATRPTLELVEILPDELDLLESGG